ncbi:peptide-binding protein [Oscillatoriales cyanobacterium USR001]|nr:peptide-binding protein [Oscillatoriales cyanobacterium USR001]
MSFKPNQTIIAGLVGVATAFGVAVATIQSQSAFHASEPQIPSQNIPTPSSTLNPETATNVSVDTTNPESVKPQPIVISPPDSGCKISMALVADPNPPLNVRDRPQLNDSKIIGKLTNNSFVSVSNEQNGWLQITEPVAGWIAKNRTKSSCPNVKQRISFYPGGTEAIVKGEIIGGGSHSYLINATKDRRITLKNYQQFPPFILTPDGKLLAQPRELEGKTEWTGTIPVTGDYTLQLDSNYKGYKYNFSVEIK